MKMFTSRWQSYDEAPRFIYIDGPRVKQFPTREDNISYMPIIKVHHHISSYKYSRDEPLHCLIVTREFDALRLLLIWYWLRF
jgi:hypothetical protein